MRLNTRITIGTETLEFHSSEFTLATNIYATLLVRDRIHRDVCKRIEQTFKTADFRRFCFHEGEIVVEVDEVPVAVEEVRFSSDLREGNGPSF